MWSLVRCLVVTLALVGLIGQTTARAMPAAAFEPAATAAATAQAPTAQVQMDCTDMPGMAATAKAQAPAPSAPCKGLTADCLGKMGCATVATFAPDAPMPVAPVAYERLAFTALDTGRAGLSPDPLFYPPKRLA